VTGTEGPHGQRRVPVDWDMLELALTWQSDEHESYLDLRTGQVVTHATWGQEEDELSNEDVDAGLAEGHLVHIERLGSSTEYGWMAEFAAAIRDPRLRERLGQALHGRGVFRRFKDALAEHPAERERWFAHRDARLREAAVAWLADNDIEPTTPPPRASSR
jgi:Uncharacterised protein family (UPF0158)